MPTYTRNCKKYFWLRSPTQLLIHGPVTIRYGTIQRHRLRSGLVIIRSHNDDPFVECIVCKFGNDGPEAVDMFRSACTPSTLRRRRSYSSSRANRKSPVECAAMAPSPDHRTLPSNEPCSAGKWLCWRAPHSPGPRGCQKKNVETTECKPKLDFEWNDAGHCYLFCIVCNTIHLVTT